MTNLYKTFDDSFKKEVIDLIKQGLKKELPAGAVYSASKKPPEGAREFTTDRGTKYWIPSKKDKEDKQAKPKSLSERFWRGEPDAYKELDALPPKKFAQTINRLQTGSGRQNLMLVHRYGSSEEKKKMKALYEGPWLASDRKARLKQLDWAGKINKKYRAILDKDVEKEKAKPKASSTPKQDKPKSRIDYRNFDSTPVAGATYTGSAVTQKVPMKNVGAWLDAIERGETDEEMRERVIGELKSDSPGKVGIPANLSDKDYSKVISNIQPDNIIRFRMLELKQNVTEGVVRSAKPQEHKRWIQEYGEDKIGDGKGGLKTPLIVQVGGLYRQNLIERGYPTEIPIDAIGRRGKRWEENGIFQVVTPKQAKPKA